MNYKIGENSHLNNTRPNSSYSTNKIFIISLTIIFVLIISGRLNAQTEDEDIILFDSNTNSISEESQEVLKNRAESLLDIGEYAITLEGYSDITGKADYNLVLSTKRAQLVKDYLVNLGIDSSSIEVIGRGGTEKYGAGETNEALEQNRRVNLIVDIPFVPAIELAPQETEPPELIEPEVNQEPVVTEEIEATPELTQQPEVTQEPVVDNNSEESYEAAPTPIPVQTISEGISKKIEKHIRQNASESIIFITPGEMQIGQTYKVEAEVSSEYIESLSKDLSDMNLEDQIGLKLLGLNFDIFTLQEDDSQFQTAGKDGPAIWEWNVIPNNDGINSLVLAVVINLKGSNNVVSQGEYDTFQRVIDVKSDFVHSITSSYWIMGFLIVLIITIVAWILLRKVRPN